MDVEPRAAHCRVLQEKKIVPQVLINAVHPPHSDVPTRQRLYRLPRIAKCKQNGYSTSPPPPAIMRIRVKPPSKRWKLSDAWRFLFLFPSAAQPKHPQAAKIMSSEAMVSFLRKTAPGVEQSLQQNETVDIFQARDYS